jgi:hypothetical protein
MRSLSERDTTALIGLLDQAEQLCREYAVEQSYRRDALLAIRETLLAQYHRQQAHHALDIAAALHQARAGLADRPRQARRSA